MERWIESEIKEGDFFVDNVDFTDMLKAVYHDYFATGEKILCFCDTKSIWPAKEICAEYYERMTRFEKEDIAEIIPTTVQTAVVKLNDGVVLWCATDTPCWDANAFCEWLFANGGVNFYHKCERKYASNVIEHFTKEEFAEY